MKNRRPEDMEKEAVGTDWNRNNIQPKKLVLENEVPASKFPWLKKK